MASSQRRYRRAGRYLSVLAVVALAVGPSGATGVHTNEQGYNETSRPPEPDHGIAPATFDRLWASAQFTPESGSTPTHPTDIVDYTFTKPPAAAAQWTAGEHGEFPTTGPETAVVPPAATPTETAWLRDAHLTVFAVQPSTVAHRSASDTRRYVRPAGTVRGVADYRVVTPADHTVHHRSRLPDPGETVLVQTAHRWSLTNHSLGEIELRADGTRIATTTGSHHPRLAYTNLPAETATLSLRTTVSVTMTHTINRQYRRATRVCESEGANDTSRDCRIEYSTYWTSTTRTPTRETTLTDSVAVTVSELTPTVTRMQFTNGEMALTIRRADGSPWAWTTAPGIGVVHSPWHFYSAARPGWSKLVVHSAEGTTHRRSDAIPLQIHAFPSTGGAYLNGTRSLRSSTRVHGPTRPAPRLPPSVTVPVATDPYHAAAVTVRTDEALPAPTDVRIHGLVRGGATRPAAVETRRQRQADLTLTVIAVNRSAETVRVRVSLQTGSGKPIDLRDRPGAVTVRNATLTPGADGTAEATVPLGTTVLTARYEPGAWTVTEPAYAPTTATASVPATWPDPIAVLDAAVRVIGVLAPLLLGIYLLDRLLGRGRLWPPWRGLE